MLIGSKLQKKNATDLSSWRLVGLVFLILSFLSAELFLPRIGGHRLNYPIFAIIASVVLAFNLQHLKANSFLLGKKLPLVFTFYIGWLFLSTLWSIEPKQTIFNSVLYLILFLSVLSYSDVNTKTTAQVIIKISVCVGILSWLFVLVKPSLAALPDVTWRLNGIMSHSQRLSLMSGIGLILLVNFGQSFSVDPARIFSYRFRIAAAIFLIITMLATQTRSFTAFILICAFSSYFLQLNQYIKIILVLSVFVIIAALMSDTSFVEQLFHRDDGADATLTGRTTIWEKTILLINQKPWLGYGFGTFMNDMTATFFQNYIPPHAHNTWINAAFETGIIGASILTMFLLGILIFYLRQYSTFGTLGLGFWLTILALLCGTMGLIFGGEVYTPLALTLLILFQEFYTVAKTKAVNNRQNSNRYYNLLSQRTNDQKVSL